MNPKRRPGTKTLRKRIPPLVVLFLLPICPLCVALAVVWFKPTGSEGGISDRNHSSQRSDAPAVHGLVKSGQESPRGAETEDVTGSANSQVYVDPATGKIGPPPQKTKRLPRTLSPAEENALSSSSAGLEETPVRGAAGGMKIDLRGRFQTEMTVSIDTQSNLSVQCSPSDGSEKKGTPREK